MYSNNNGILYLDSSVNKISINGSLNAKQIQNTRSGSLIKSYFIKPFNTYTPTTNNDVANNNTNDWLINTTNYGDNALEMFNTQIQLQNTNVNSMFVGLIYYNYDCNAYNGIGADKFCFYAYVNNTITDAAFYESMDFNSAGALRIPRPLMIERYIPAGTSDTITVSFQTQKKIGANDYIAIQKSSIYIMGYQYVSYDNNEYKIYNTAGTFTDTIPYWCSRIAILLVGGGGGGGAGGGSYSNYGYGNVDTFYIDYVVCATGGGGGRGTNGSTYVNNNITVSPNSKYTINVGSGGSKGIYTDTSYSISSNNNYLTSAAYNGTSGTTGGNTVFSITTGTPVTYTANGGIAGTGGTAGSGGGYTGGVGGSIDGSNGINQFVRKPTPPDPYSLRTKPYTTQSMGGISSPIPASTYNTIITVSPSPINLGQNGQAGNGGNGERIQTTSTTIYFDHTDATDGNPGYAIVFFYEK